MPPPPLASISSQHYAAVVAIPDGRIAVLGEYAMASSGIIDYELGISRFDNGGGADASFNSNGFRPFAFGEAKRMDTQRSVVLLAQTLENGQTDLSFGPAGKRSDDVDGLLNNNAHIVSLELDNLGRPVIGVNDVAIDERANPNGGRLFRFAFIPTFAPAGNAFLRITGNLATTGTVTTPSLAEPIPFSVTPGAVTQVTLNEVLHNALGNDQVFSRGITGCCPGASA
jgi:hypothetical protein